LDRVKIQFSSPAKGCIYGGGHGKKMWQNRSELNAQQKNLLKEVLLKCLVTKNFIREMGGAEIVCSGMLS